MGIQKKTCYLKLVLEDRVQSNIKDLLEYNPKTGEIFWKISPNIEELRGIKRDKSGKQEYK